jgi:polysaccharide export outer membrane protein
MRIKRLFYFVVLVSVVANHSAIAEDFAAPDFGATQSMMDDGPAPTTEGLLEGGGSIMAPANYKILPSDVLVMNVFQHPDLGTRARVEADGTIHLHLVGRVNVQGLTLSEAREKITELYNRDFLVNPQVELQISEFNLDRVQILGQVRTPGVVGIPPDEDLTLVQAIARVGGFTRLARTGAVQIRRTSPDGEITVVTVNARDLIRDPDAKEFVLKNGDIVFVDERLL